MGSSELAQWLSEYPKLIEIVQKNPRAAEYLSKRRPNPLYARKQVDEETWKNITDQLK